LGGPGQSRVDGRQELVAVGVGRQPGQTVGQELVQGHVCADQRPHVLLWPSQLKDLVEQFESPVRSAGL
jgi:hypothetical protein